MKRQRVRIDCQPKAVRPWRLECVDDTVWSTFGEGVPRPLGVTAEVLPALRRLIEEVGDAGELAAGQSEKEKI